MQTIWYSLVSCSSSQVRPYFYNIALDSHCALVVALAEKATIPFGMAIGNVELMHECFPKHSRIETARMKLDKETDKNERKKE